MSPVKTKRNARIRAQRKSGLSFRELARAHKLDVRTVYDIVRRKSPKLSTR